MREPEPTGDRAGRDALVRFVADRRRLFVLTGAGCSTESGIPDYRDSAGDWKHTRPVQFQDFIRHPATRQRYWARSLVGWRYFSTAQPNLAHAALATLEHRGHLNRIVTQNVDGLHQQAGSRNVVDLHGRLDAVACLDCGARTGRHRFQQELGRRNPGWAGLEAERAPDGDVDLKGPDYSGFDVPDCEHCGGTLKPAVVFFGEAVPRETVAEAMDSLSCSDGVLVVGSSLMVFSGFRFVRAAHAAGIPVAAVNLGRTRADDTLALKVRAAAGPTLSELSRRLAATGGGG